MRVAHRVVIELLQAKERVMEAVSTAAGAVADPRTGLRRVKARLMSARTGLVAACLLAGYLIGRRTVQHRTR